MGGVWTVYDVIGGVDPSDRRGRYHVNAARLGSEVWGPTAGGNRRARRGGREGIR